MLTRRQIANSQARETGVSVAATYQTDLGLYDRVEVLISESDSPAACRIVGRVTCIIEHGYYQVLTIQDGPAESNHTLYRDGPEEWGIVECRIIERWHKRPRPEVW